MSLAIVILAAGKGTRLHSRRPKALHAIGGKPLLGHVVSAASRIVAAADVFVVVGHEAARVQEALAATGVQFVLQPDPLGTGHAIECARQAIAGYSDILVLPGDLPLIRSETIGLLWEVHESERAAMTVLTARTGNQSGYGRVVRLAGDPVGVEAIVEQKSLKPEQAGMGEVDSGIYAFRTKTLLEHLPALSEAEGERSLAEIAGVLSSAGERVVLVEAADGSEVLGVNTIAELVALDSALRAKTALRLMDQGVTIHKPETCVIDAGVEVGPDTVIEPYVQLLGETRIGSDCLIRSGTVIENATLADGVLVRQSCVIAESSIASGAKIGPFAHLRPGSEIGEDAHVGNFVETKKAKLGNGAKANHLTYLGDAEIGAGTNIGAGVITCNYDGVNKRMTRIGAGVFVGSDSTLVAPLTIEDGAYIGAGSCITKDVPQDSLAVARTRQVTKEGWAAAKRKLQKEGC